MAQTHTYGEYTLFLTEDYTEGWGYDVEFDGEVIFERDPERDLDTVEEALDEAKENIDNFPRPWRKPDWEIPNLAVWWAPSDDAKNAESFTVVSGDCEPVRLRWRVRGF